MFCVVQRTSIIILIFRKKSIGYFEFFKFFQQYRELATDNSFRMHGNTENLPLTTFLAYFGIAKNRIPLNEAPGLSITTDRGLEPLLTESESAVLPLHQSALV